MKPANSVLIRSSDTESAGPTAPQCRESLFYLFCLSTLTGADHSQRLPQIRISHCRNNRIGIGISMPGQINFIHRTPHLESRSKVPPTTGRYFRAMEIYGDGDTQDYFASALYSS